MKKIDKNTLNPEELVSLEHEWFFNYLRISPSYQLAHAIKTGQKRKREAKLIPRFEEVMNTYKLLGNVFETNFPKWWETQGPMFR